MPPIPGDNGQPQKERDDQNERITREAETGANVRRELNLNEPAPKQRNIFGTTG